MIATIVEDPRWPAIVERDKAADGRFWYSVATTGVFCRPSCPSRLARPENVAIHDTIDQARAIGFRPCLRCRPDEPSAEERTAALVKRAAQTIETAEGEPTLAALAAQANMSQSRFHRLFKQATGLTPKAYAAACRARRLRDMLPDASSVTDAIYGAGYSSSGRFYEGGEALLGMTPARARAGGEGERLAWSVTWCSLGHVLVASSTRGVAAILLGDHPAALEDDLRRRFPRATLEQAGPEHLALVEQVVALVNGDNPATHLPLDIRGTAFQHRVWLALRDVPAGMTVSYAELARRIGAPGSSRAVAGACAANPLAVAVPCHRVLRGDGDLSGYRWGVERKRHLLDREWDQRSASSFSTTATSSGASTPGPVGATSITAIE